LARAQMIRVGPVGRQRHIIGNNRGNPPHVGL